MSEIDVTALPGIREPVSALSHLIGAAVFLVCAFRLIRRGRGDRLRTASLVIMAGASVLLLTLSGNYHLFWPGPLRRIMVMADISAVFVLIAGLVTPVHVILFRGKARWWPLALAWTTAIAGVILRIALFDSISGRAGIAIFLLFGWGCAITAAVLWHRHGWAFIQNGVLSGLSYTVGAIILAEHRPILVAGVIGPHEIWHFAVLAGLALHWNFVFQFASGELPATLTKPAAIPLLDAAGAPAADPIVKRAA